MPKTNPNQPDQTLQARVTELEPGLQNISQVSPLGLQFYELQADDRLILVGHNPAANRILGLEHAPLIGKSLEEAFPELVQTEIPERLRKTAQEGERWETSQVWYIDPQRDRAYEIHLVQTAPKNVAVIFWDRANQVRNEAALQQRAAQLTLLNKVGEQIAAVLDLEKVFQKAVQLVQESFGYHHVGIFTLDAKTGLLAMQAKAGGFSHFLPPNHALQIDQGMVGWAFRNNQNLLSNDVSTDAHYVNLYPGVLPTRSELCMPIHVGERVIGVLDAQSPETNAFDESDVMVLQTLADQIAIAIENARLHTAVQKELQDRKRAESELRIQTTALEAAANGVVITDHNGIIQWANPSFTQLTGFALPEVIGIHLRQIISEHRDAEINDEIWSTVSSGQVWRGEISSRRKDGSVYIEEITITPVKDSAGCLTHLIAIRQNITERKLIEGTLRMVVEGISGATGATFFRLLVEHLSRALGVDCVFVGEYLDPGRICTRALFAKGAMAENVEFALEHTPYANLMDRGAFIYAQGAQEHFALEPLLTGMEIQGYVGVPLLDSTGNPLGILVVLNGSAIPNEALALSILEVFGAQAAAELERMKVEAESQKRAQQLAALNEMGQMVTASLEIETVLEQVIQAFPRLIGAEGVSVLLKDGDERLVFAAASGESGQKLIGRVIPADAGIAGMVLETQRAILVNNEEDQRLLYRDIEKVSQFHTQSLLAVPLILRGELIGVMEAVHARPNAFTQDDLQIMETAGSWASIAIGNARQHAATERRLKETQALVKINQALNETLELDRLLKLMVDSISQIIPHIERVVFHLYDEEKALLIPKAVSGVEPDHKHHLLMQDGQGIAGQVIEKGIPINVADTRNDLRFVPIEGAAYLRSLLVVPVQSGGRRLGTISVSSTKPETFTPEDEHLLSILGVQIALALESARLFQSEQQRRKEAEILRDVTTTLTSTLEIDQVITYILDQLSLALHYDSASVFLLEGNQARIVAAKGFPSAQNVIGLRLDAAKNLLFQQIQQTRQPIIVADVHDEPDWDPSAGYRAIRGWMGIPLIAQEEVIGFLTIDRHEINAYTLADAELAQAFANQAAVALQNAQLFVATRRRLAESNALFFISNLIIASSDLDVETILHQVVDLLWQEFGYYHAHVYLIDQSSGALIANQGSGPIGAQLKQMGYQFTTDEGIVGYAATIGEAFLTNDVAETHFFKDHPLLPDTCAEFAAPLKARDQILGVLDIQHKAPNTFDEDDFRFLVAVADQLAVVLDKALLYNELQAALAKEQKTRDQLVQAEKLAAMGRLIASVAHELNNPLQAIQNALYLVKLEENLSPQASEDIQVAIDEGARMAGLIARLRDTYRPTSAADFQFESLNNLVDEVQKLIGTHLRHHNIRFEFIPDNKLPALRIIRDQIKQVILNLCINAIESMPNGGELTIYTTYQAEENLVYLSVSDTGTGLTPEAQSKIFEPFFTTKEGGTGLGLAVSYEIAQNHGGLISAQNNDTQKGSTFTLSLPGLQAMIE